MNYGGHYARLIDRAIDRSVRGYVEVHHVLPKCMGGTDVASNLVKLTAREHYLAHLLLVRMFPCERSLVFAAHMMTVDRYGSRHGNRKYEWLRIRHSQATAAAKRGNAYGLGTRRTDATKRKMSAAQKGHKHGVGRVFDRATRKRIADSCAGKAKSPSHAQSLSDAQLVRAEFLPPYRDGSKRVPGVTQRPNGAFVARVRVAGKRKYLGYFTTLADAQAALDALC